MPRLTCLLHNLENEVFSSQPTGLHDLHIPVLVTSLPFTSYCSLCSSDMGLL